MNRIKMQFTIDDEQLLSTMFTTIQVEMEATKTDRGEAFTSIEGSTLILEIVAQDLVATRAITNSIMRLLGTIVDVANSIKPK